MSHIDPVLAGVLAAAAEEAAAHEEACADPQHCRFCCGEDFDEWEFDDDGIGEGFECAWCRPVP